MILFPKLRSLVAGIERRLGAVEQIVAFTVDCETCGCMIKRSLAVEGEKEVRSYKTIQVVRSFGSPATEYVIHQNFYCKRCAVGKGVAAGGFVKQETIDKLRTDFEEARVAKLASQFPYTIEDIQNLHAIVGDRHIEDVLIMARAWTTATGHGLIRVKNLMASLKKDWKA